MLQPPARPEPESWGSGYIDYPTMVQPVLDQHCVRCHGGPEGIGNGLDFSGGWTWAFNISYETLIKNRLVGFLNCDNGSVHTSRDPAAADDRLRRRAAGRDPHQAAPRDVAGPSATWCWPGWTPTATTTARGTTRHYATCDAILDARGAAGRR